MNNEVTRRWLEAGKIIALNINAKVICPVCRKRYLRVLDVENPKNSFQFERHMICDECGAYNALRMNKPPTNEPFGIGGLR